MGASYQAASEAVSGVQINLLGQTLLCPDPEDSRAGQGEPVMVNFRPSQFAEDGGVLDLSLPEVVGLYLDTEKHRHKQAKEDENQQVDVVTSRVAPVGLIMALDGNARRLGITRAMLTRCLSHQIVAWLDSQSRIGEIAGLFNIASDAAEEYGYPDLYDKMAPGYAFSSAAPRYVSFRTIAWVKHKLFALALPLGIPAGSLFIVGLCYSLTRAGGGTKGTITKYLSAEVDNFTRCVDERSVWVVGFNDLVRKRARDEGLEENPNT